jgi:hypothetical protein
VQYSNFGGQRRDRVIRLANLVRNDQNLATEAGALDKAILAAVAKELANATM